MIPKIVLVCGNRCRVDRSQAENVPYNRRHFVLPLIPIQRSHLLLDLLLRSKVLAALQDVKQVWRHDDIAVDVSVVVRVHELASAVEHVRHERHVVEVHAVVALAVDTERRT